MNKELNNLRGKEVDDFEKKMFHEKKVSFKIASKSATKTTFIQIQCMKSRGLLFKRIRLITSMMFI